MANCGVDAVTGEVDAWLERLGLAARADDKVETLSKGMSQKLQFVITVLHEPGLIILDEPFSGLDPVNANLIKDEIYALARKGATIIFSTHRMEQVEEICDHIILMNKGKKILDGTVSGVKQQFKENLFRIGLEGEWPGAHGSAGVDAKPGPAGQAEVDAIFSTTSAGQAEVDAIFGATSAAFEIVGREQNNLVVKIVAGHRPNDVLRYFIDRGQNITAFTEILPSLNDIFIRLVEGTPLSRQFERR